MKKNLSSNVNSENTNKKTVDRHSLHKKRVTKFLIGIVPIIGLVFTVIQTCKNPPINLPIINNNGGIIYVGTSNSINDNSDIFVQKLGPEISSYTENSSTTNITYTVKSRMLDINDDRTPFEAYTKSAPSDIFNIKLYDIDYGFNERAGYVLFYFIINDAEIIEKSSITTAIFSREFNEDFTIVAVYTPETEDNPRLDDVYHPFYIIGKKLNGESVFEQGYIRLVENNEPLTVGRHGEWYYFNGITTIDNNRLVKISINGTMVENLSSTHQYIDGIPVKFEDGFFYINIIKGTALIFYYE